MDHRGGQEGLLYRQWILPVDIPLFPSPGRLIPVFMLSQIEKKGWFLC
jgi:hypothetical protein